MNRYPIGPSSYGDLRGKMQFVNSARIAAQFLSLKIDFDRLPSSRATGARLSANEGMRSRVRQMYLWVNRFILGVVVAVPYSSRHDELTRGNAIDVGVTMPDGSNRALTAAEFAWMHHECERRGFTWTGRLFGEPWHIEGATRGEIVNPYPAGRANVDYAFGPIPDAAKPAPAPKPEPIPEPEPPYIPKDNDMIYIRSDKGSRKAYVLGEFSVEAPGEDLARTYSLAVPHEDGTSLFTELSSAKVSALITAVRDRRDAFGLKITDTIVRALAAEDAPEGK